MKALSSILVLAVCSCGQVVDVAKQTKGIKKDEKEFQRVLNLESISPLHDELMKGSK